jgi:hypothetical protein
MQRARSHVAFGGDLEHETTSAAPIERAGVERLDPSGGVGIGRLGAFLLEKCDRSDETATTVSGPPQTRRNASATL